MTNHRHGAEVVQAQRAGAGGRPDVRAGGQHMQDAMQGRMQLGGNYAGGDEARR
jgi:hypothetical protein